MAPVKLTKNISSKQFMWRNDPRINAWTRQNGLISEADQANWFKKIETDNTIQMFGILAPSKFLNKEFSQMLRPDQASGVLGVDYHVDTNVGTCGLTSISPVHGTAEFSLLIGPEYQNNGYGKAALIELLKYGFNHLRLNCIWGETFEGNHALKMFLSLGMKEEGRLRSRYFKNGEYKDSIMVSILQSEARSQSWWNGQ